MGGLGVLLAHVLGMLVLDGRISDLDAEQEGNALTWLASTAAGSAAVAALLLAFVPPVRRVLILALAGGLAFLSLSEAAEVHERLGSQVAEHLFRGSGAWAHRIQPLTILPALALVFLVVALLAARAPRTARTSLLSALVALVLSLLTEQLAGPLTNRLEEKAVIWPDVIRNGLEEGLEVSGWIVLASALFAMVLARWSRARSD